MRVFAVKDEEDETQKILAYLICYEYDQKFVIELPEDADPWETPLLLSGFAKKGEYTVPADWSKLWVQQRIVPMDRQNIGTILKDNGLSEYDELKLLIISQGRCAQDSYYIEEIDGKELKNQFAGRYGKHILDAFPAPDYRLIFFCDNGETCICNMLELELEKNRWKNVLANEELFRQFSILTGGYGISWNQNLEVPAGTLYDHATKLPLQRQDFIGFVQESVVCTQEAAKMLDCSRQNINDLVKRGKLSPVRTDQKNMYFLKADVLKRLWQ